MLIEFSVANYRSFKERATLSMVAANIKSKPEWLDEENVFRITDDLTLLKSAAIYGANASGKSNLIAALRFMREFVLGSSRDTQVGERINVEPFLLSTATEGKPSHFEIVFLLDGVIHRYGFEVNAERVVAEWLYHTPGRREARLFERDSDDIKRNSRTFREGRDLEPRTRSNALYLSVVAQFNGKMSVRILQLIETIHLFNANYFLEESIEMSFANAWFERGEMQKDIIDFVKNLDLGVTNAVVERNTIDYSNLPDKFVRFMGASEFGVRVMEETRPYIKTVHDKFDDRGDIVENVVFDLEENESRGTQKLFVLAFPLLRSLRLGLVLVIDEIDARLHPLITRNIIRLFNSKDTNPHNAQLIFTTHDTNLLSGALLRRDQIWFVEKSRRGESVLYSLVEYREQQGKMIRNDASFEKDYIAGRYGAIPYIGDLNALPGMPDGEQGA